MDAQRGPNVTVRVLTEWGASKGPPNPPDARKRPGKPGRSSRLPGRLSLQLRPGLVDPGVRRRRLALGPAGRRRDAADRDGDDPRGIEDRERILRRVLAEADDRVLVALVIVRTDVDVAGGTGHHQAFEHRNDRVILRPAADELVGLVDGGLEHVRGRVPALRLEVRILVEALVELLDERL